MFKNSVSKQYVRVIGVLALSLLSCVTRASTIAENLSGSPVNNQGRLSYTVPLDFPEGKGGLTPGLSATYTNGGGVGTLGAGFSVSGASAVTRCQGSRVEYSHVGGIHTDSRARYCLDGQALHETNVGGQYAPYIHGNMKVTFSGSYNSPSRWQVKDGTGYTYIYEVVDNSTSEVNRTWLLKSKSDIFGNTLEYEYTSHSQIERISYSGLEVEFRYTDVPIGEVYSAGSEVVAGYIVDEIALQKNSSDIYKYKFRYEEFVGYRTIPVKRLKGIKKCYEGGDCTNEISFDYSGLTGSFISELPHPDNVRNIMTDEFIVRHSEIGSEEQARSNPNYIKGNLNNSGSEEICFYSIQDTLVCAVSDITGKYFMNERVTGEISIISEEYDKKRQVTVSYLGQEYEITVGDDEYYQYFSGIRFIDMNRDGFDDLCLADDGGVKCLENLTGEDGEINFGTAQYVTTQLNYDTDYLVVDVDRDGYPDFCGNPDDDSFKCFRNNGAGSLIASPVLSKWKAGEFNPKFETRLQDTDGEEDYHFYKELSLALLDVTGDQIPEACYANSHMLNCYEGYYKSNNILDFRGTSAVYSYALYESVPDDLMTTPMVGVDRNNQTGIDYSKLKERAKRFDKIKDVNEIITLSHRYIDINSDGLVDICYVKSHKLNCSLNNGLRWLEPRVYSDFTIGHPEIAGVGGEGGYNTATLKSIYSSVSFIDINTDGAIDACYSWGDQQYCAYNEKDSLTDFTLRFKIVSKPATVIKRFAYHTNHINKVLGPKTRHRHAHSYNIYGPTFHIEDISGDMRTEHCMRTINGIDCYSNEQQSHIAVLTDVEDSFGNTTNFAYGTLYENDFYTSGNQRSDTNFIEKTPGGLFLTEMKQDTGVGLPGSSEESISYSYDTFRINPLTGVGGYDSVSQETSISNKKDVTEYYQKDNLVGKVLSTSSYQNGHLLEQSTNSYSVVSARGLKALRLGLTESTQYDPKDSTRLKTTITTYSQFDDYNFPRYSEEVKTAYLPSETQVKKVNTDTVYSHSISNWVLGKPSAQVVTHNLTGADIQTKTVSYEYYPETMALKYQTIEPEHKFKRRTEYTYHGDGTLHKKSITGLVNDTTTDTRTTEYPEYTDVGQAVEVVNSNGDSARTTYHSRCLAPQYIYDANDRLVKTNFYDQNCYLYKAEENTGLISHYSKSWSSEEMMYEPTFENSNNIILEKVSYDNLGGYQAEYYDRAGRLLKSVKRISKDDNYDTYSVSFNNYDQRGLKVAESLPVLAVNGTYNVSSIPTWKNTEYDAYYRPIAISGVAPDGSLQTNHVNYDGFQTTYTYLGEEKISIIGVLGKTISSVEHGKKVTYTYTSLGELHKTQLNDNPSTTTTIGYNDVGSKTSQVSPSTGSWSYKFNAFGELFSQTDAAGVTTSISYDELGRKTGKTVDGEGTTTWNYFYSGNGIGQLQSTTSADGVTRSYSYDSLGRVEDEYFLVDGEQLNRTHYDYDEVGRMMSAEYNKDADDESMVTPIKTKYDQASNPSAITLPADKLKSYNYERIEDQYSAAIQQIVELDQYITSIENRISYHAEKLQEYEARQQFYETKAIDLEADTSDIDNAIKEHQDLIARYTAKYNEYKEKVDDDGFGGVDAKRRYKYKGYDSDTGEYKFKYKKCTARNWLGKCVTRKSGEIALKAEEFQRLGGDDFLKACKIVTSATRKPLTNMRHRSGNSHPSRKGIFIGEVEVTKNVTRRGQTETITSTAYQFKICENKKFNAADIYLRIADSYKVAAEKERAFIAGLTAERDAIVNEVLPIDVEVEKKTTAWIPVSITPGLLIPVIKTHIEIQQQEMVRGDGQDYYNEKATEYSELADEHRSRIAALGDELSNENGAYIQDAELKAASAELLSNINAFTSLQALQDASRAQGELAGSDLTVWAALSYDAQGRLKSELFGNGIKTTRRVNPDSQMIEAIITEDFTGKIYNEIEYTYSADGTLDDKTQTRNNVVESFDYLNNELESWNITFKGMEADSRFYEYDDLGNITSKGQNSYTYENTEKPFTLTSFNGEVVATDSKGHIKSANGVSYTWTNSGKARTVSEGQYTTSYEYDSDVKRAVKNDSEGTTYYISPTYEQVHKGNGDILHRFNIKNGYETVTTIERYEYADDLPDSQIDNRPQDKAAYYSRDILGSGVLITGPLGQVVAERYYSPYGEYVEVPESLVRTYEEIADELAIDATTAELFENHEAVVEAAESELGIDEKLLGKALTVTTASGALRGFTGHEELPDIGVVNMNARMYDPVLARFLSPDSIVPEPDKPAAFNRYSYVYNNPTLASDPTGHWVFLAVATASFITAHAYTDSTELQMATRIALMAATGPGAGATLGQIAITAGGTALAMNVAVSGRLGPAEARSALFTAASAAVSAYIGHGVDGNSPLFDETWQQAAAHGVAQGTLTVLQGGSFWGAFVSGNISHYSGVAMNGAGGRGLGAKFGRTMIASASGALSSKATGGDAIQGALVAAMVHLFNGELRRDKMKKKYAGKEDAYVGFTFEGSIPGLGLVQQLTNSDLPIDSGYVDIGFIQPGRDSLTSGGGDLNGGFNFGESYGGASVLSLNYREVDTVGSVDLVYGVGVKIHFDNEGMSGIGLAVGYSGSPKKSFSKLQELYNMYKKTDISVTASKEIGGP